jgi:hypothetical protein
MLQIIGYITFILITAALCMGAAVVGTITGIKQNELMEELNNGNN